MNYLITNQCLRSKIAGLPNNADAVHYAWRAISVSRNAGTLIETGTSQRVSRTRLSGTMQHDITAISACAQSQRVGQMQRADPAACLQDVGQQLDLLLRARRLTINSEATTNVAALG